MGCTGIKKVVLPNGLKYIGCESFSKNRFEELVLPSSVETVAAWAFSECTWLKRVQLNEGLKTLGEKVRFGRREFDGEVFFKSGIEHIRIPSSVKAIEICTFSLCDSLKTVEFSEGLEKICVGAFAGSAIEDIVLPSSVRAIGALAFAECMHLRSVRLNEGLEVLGEEQCLYGELQKGHVFDSSSLERVTISSTLKTVEPETFIDCKNLWRVEFPEGLVSLGRDGSDNWNRLLAGSGVEEVTLPSTLREARSNIFEGCDRLRVVWVRQGCTVDVSKLVKSSVEVAYV